MCLTSEERVLPLPRKPNMPPWQSISRSPGASENGESDLRHAYECKGLMSSGFDLGFRAWVWDSVLRFLFTALGRPLVLQLRLRSLRDVGQVVQGLGLFMA